MRKDTGVLLLWLWEVSLSGRPNEPSTRAIFSDLLVSAEATMGIA